MQVEMQLSRIIISEINEQQVIYLREVDGHRQFPILIGIFEATSIDRRVKHYESPRPLTHDLLVSAVESMGGELESVIITELRDHTYFANLRVRYEGEMIDIDADLPMPSPWPSPATRRCRSMFRKKCSRTRRANESVKRFGRVPLQSRARSFPCRTGARPKLPCHPGRLKTRWDSR